MKDIKRSITFFLEKRKNASTGKVATESVPIRLSIAWMGQRFMTSSGQRVNASNWDIEAQRVKGNKKEKSGRTPKEINNALNSLYMRIDDYFRMCEVGGMIPNKRDLQAEMSRGTINPVNESGLSVADAYSQFIDKAGLANGWSIATYKKQQSTKTHFANFKPDLRLHEIDKDVITEFTGYLLNAGLRNSSTNKYLKLLYWFLKWCAINGLYDGNKVLAERPKLREVKGKGKPIIYLTWEELMRLKDFPFKQSSYRQVRDVFCFCCFTGLRYSDVFMLKTSDVRPNRIVFTTKKTGERLEVDLNKYAKEMLGRYNGIVFKGGKALPVISNQKMNDYLKEVCGIAGIDEKITEVYYIGNRRQEITLPKYELVGSHAGRRTFITNSLAMGIPTEVIMKWTGHKSHEVMKPYLAVVDKLKAQEMAKWDRIK